MTRRTLIRLRHRILQRQRGKQVNPNPLEIKAIHEQLDAGAEVEEVAKEHVLPVAQIERLIRGRRRWRKWLTVSDGWEWGYPDA